MDFLAVGTVCFLVFAGLGFRDADTLKVEPFVTAVTFKHGSSCVAAFADAVNTRRSFGLFSGASTGVVSVFRTRIRTHFITSLFKTE